MYSPIFGAKTLALCLLFPATLLAEKKPPITESDVVVFNDCFAKLKQKYITAKEAIDSAEESKKLKGKELEFVRKNLHLTYLFAVMDIERDLVILSTPSEIITKDVKVPELTSRDNSRISKLRLGITIAERARIKQGLKNKKPNYGEERYHLDLLKKEIDLWRLYLRAAKKTDREITKLEKALAKEKKSSIPSEKGIKKLQTELDELLKEKKSLTEPIFGYVLGSGFDPHFTIGLKSASDLQLALKKEREAKIHFLRTGETNQGEDGKRGGNIGGTFIYSENLGVILDISGSMTRYIEPLKEEIAESFEKPHYREVVGCSLRNGTRYPSTSLRVSKRTHTIPSFAELLLVNQVDTIYWFCDLMDVQDPAAIRNLLNLLTRTGAAFHVKSVNKDASRLLEPLITDFQRG